MIFVHSLVCHHEQVLLSKYPHFLELVEKKVHYLQLSYFWVHFNLHTLSKIDFNVYIYGKLCIIFPHYNAAVWVTLYSEVEYKRMGKSSMLFFPQDHGGLAVLIHILGQYYFIHFSLLWWYFSGHTEITGATSTPTNSLERHSGITQMLMKSKQRMRKGDKCHKTRGVNQVVEGDNLKVSLVLHELPDLKQKVRACC